MLNSAMCTTRCVVQSKRYIARRTAVTSLLVAMQDQTFCWLRFPPAKPP
jgi:hypothetical protein